MALPPPSEWGPKYWYIIDLTVATYGTQPTNSQKQHVFRWFNALVEVLPCDRCRAHYKQLWKRNPLTARHLANSTTLEKWVAWMKGEVSKGIAERQGHHG